MFSQVPVHKGRCTPPGHTPLVGRHPHQANTPLAGRHPSPPGQTPPRQADTRWQADTSWRADPPPSQQTATAVDGTHSTAMHSCSCILVFKSFNGLYYRPQGTAFWPQEEGRVSLVLGSFCRLGYLGVGHPRE